MKLENLGEAAQLADQLRDATRAITNAHDALGITLRGTYQDGRLVDEVRPVIVAVLERRRRAILERLEALGVVEA